MDPISHGLVGSMLPLAFTKGKNQRKAGIIGFGSALLADLDVLISSGSDPLLNLEFHRHFTHALAFVPLGGLVAAALFWLVFRGKLGFKQIYLWAVMGYGTAGLLDACTTYGTRIFLPFMSEKISFNLISILDPLFTLGLLGFLFVAFKKNRTKPAWFGLVFMAAYLSLGGIQKERAREMVMNLAEQRGHQVSKLTLKPTMGNLLVWRSIYIEGDSYHIDALRPALFGKEQVFIGGKLPAFKILKDMPQLPPDSALAKDIMRFGDFSQGHLAFDPMDDKVIGDVRYAMLPNGIRPIWGIRIDRANPETQAKFENFREPNPALGKKYLGMILGQTL